MKDEKKKFRQYSVELTERQKARRDLKPEEIKSLRKDLKGIVVDRCPTIDV